MKNIQINIELLTEKALDYQEFIIYMLLISAREQNPGYIEISIDKLAEQSGFAESNVRKILKRLIEKGYVSKKRRGLNLCNLYTILK